MGLLEDAIASGDIAGQARLSPLLASAQLNMATPPGAEYSADAPLGFTIADPRMRDQYANVQADSARAVAGSNYINDFERDRLKNSLALMKASDHLDPQLQALVLERLGIHQPQQPRPTGIQTPWGIYQGAREGDTGSPEAIWGQSMPSGFMSDKVKQAYAEYALKAPEREMAQRLKEIQAMIQLKTADTNELYKRDLINARNEAMNNQKYGMIARLNDALKKTEVTPLDPDPVKLQKQMQGQVIQGLIQQLTADLVQGDATQGGGGPPSVEGGTAWWDRALPAGGGPSAIPQWNASAAPSAGVGRGPTTLPPGVQAMPGGWGASRNRPKSGGTGAGVTSSGKRFTYTRE